MTINEVHALLGSTDTEPNEIPFSHVARHDGDRIHRYYPLGCMRNASEFLLNVETGEVELFDYVNDQRVKHILSCKEYERVTLGRPQAHSRCHGMDVVNWVTIPVFVDDLHVEDITVS